MVTAASLMVSRTPVPASEHICTWQLKSPGRSVLPPRSTTFAPSGTEMPEPISFTMPDSTRTLPSLRTVSPMTSMMFAWVNTVVMIILLLKLPGNSPFMYGDACASRHFGLLLRLSNRPAGPYIYRPGGYTFNYNSNFWDGKSFIPE